jgi:hypothetical protein
MKEFVACLKFGSAPTRMRHHPPCTVIVRESRRSSIPEALVMEPARRGVLVIPHPRGMTTEFADAAFSIIGVFSWALSNFASGKIRHLDRTAAMR